VNDLIQISAAFLLGKETWPPLHRILGEPKAGLDVAKKSKTPRTAENQIPAIRNIADHYIDGVLSTTSSGLCVSGQLSELTSPRNEAT
jgi:hypothetical protein